MKLKFLQFGKALGAALFVLLLGVAWTANAQVSTWDGSWEPWTNGTGTESDPFLIENAQQLAYLAYRVNNGLDANGTHISNHDYHYKLMTDVNLNGSEDFQWTPIGYFNEYDFSDYQCFGGRFDGNGHNVSGIYISSSAIYVGFFGYTNGAVVKNLTVMGTKVSTSGNTAGGLIGSANGSIVLNNCNCNIKECTSSGYAGGIVGSNGTGESDSCTIINCYNTGNISSSMCGGIIGQNYSSNNGNTIITNCYNTGNISGATCCGGIIGFNRHSGSGSTTITNCYNTGNISDATNSGGIVGRNEYQSDNGTTIIANCYNTGNVSSTTNGGGIIGYNLYHYTNCCTSIANCYNTGSVAAGYNNGGGIIGYNNGNSNNTTINNNSYYVNGCNNLYGGQPMSPESMQTIEFVNTLNNGDNIWTQDTYHVNQGFPIFSNATYVITHDASITQTTATLNGAFYIGDVTGRWGFEYKAESDTEFQTIEVTEVGNVSKTITGLAENTLYIYHAFFSKEGVCTIYGEDKIIGFSSWDGSWEPWTHGTGTEENPFLIENAKQLAYLAYRVNNGLDAAGGHVSNHDYHYKLMVDVGLNGSEDFQWTPIGYWNSDSDYQCFGGHFDGNNHTISGLYINSTANRVGFFGYTDGASVENLGTNAQTITTTGQYAGGVIGYANGPTNISNCHNTGSVTAKASTSFSGGIIGHVAGTITITNCYNTGSATASGNGSYKYGGGIAGYVANGTIAITNCYNTGSIIASNNGGGTTSNNGGGIIGWISSGTTNITNCYNTGSITANNNGGGIIGRSNSTANITNCYNTGNVTGGGIVGYKYTGVVNNSYYLNTCGGNNTYGGQPMSADAMRTSEFVDILNNGSCAFEYDINLVNSGYPILTMIQVSVATSNATDVSQSHATLHGNIIVENASVQSKGFEYKKASDQNYQTVTVSGNGEVSKTLSNLSPNTQYQYRTFCITNSCEGTSYGEEKIFTTLAISTVTENSSDITQSHATLNGTFSIGDANIATKGFEYRKTTDTVYQTVNVTGEGNVSHTLSELVPNTQYSYRTFCKATGCDAIYGTVKTFTTLPINLTTNNASDITQTSATLNGVFDMGDAAGTWGFEYKAESETGFNAIAVTETGDVSRTLTGLMEHTEYKYHTFYAIAGNDSIFGEEKTFRTTPPWDGSWEPWTQGTGTEDDPFLIENAKQLAYLAYRVNNGLDAAGGHISNQNLHYKLMVDVNLYGSEDFQWAPIGYCNSDSDYQCFGGHFDGNDHTVSGLYVNSSAGRVGFFGFTDGASIENLNVTGTRVQTTNGNAGGIIGVADGYVSISNCSCSLTDGVFATRYTGGIVGCTYNPSGNPGANIANCYNTGDVSSNTYNSYAGGIVGYNSNTLNITNCYNTGNISNTDYYYSYAGGMVGGSNNTLGITNSYNTGNVSAYTGYYSGGIVGYASSAYTVTNSYYLTTCGGNNTYGGQSMSAAAMQTEEFVDMLNNGGCVWEKDTEPYLNDGYPTLRKMQNDAFTENATEVADVSATLHGSIKVVNATVTDKGFEYKKVDDTEYTRVSVTTAGNILSCNLNGLTPNTTYEYRTFLDVAECDNTAYGENVQFTVSWLNQDTIYIYDADMLRWVSEQCNSGTTFEGKYIMLMNNIVLPLNQPNNMTSIGIYPDYPFKGTFDGNGMLITNLYIDQPNTPYQGFFGYTSNAYLYNVGLVNITASGRNYTGGMVAYARNTHLRDCYVNGGTLFALSYCGGLVGYQTSGTNSIMSGCYNTCTVSGNNYVGGLLGYSDHGTVRNSYVASSVEAQGAAVGAIIGGADEVLMYNCFFNSETTGQPNAIGENNYKGGEGMTSEQMRNPAFVTTLNQSLTIPVWKSDYSTPINSGFPILKWQYSDIESCGAPENLQRTINGASITFTWSAVPNASYYIVEYGVQGQSAQTQNTFSNSFTFNAQNGSTYYWRVKSVCSFGESNFVNGTNVYYGIGESTSEQITLYPNPTSGLVTIEAENLRHVSVFNVMGQKVLESTSEGNRFECSLSNYGTGIYMMQIETTNGIATRRVVVER